MSVIKLLKVQRLSARSRAIWEVPNARSARNRRGMPPVMI
ncbi:hypothetical protein VPHD69_0205 [Vibrio phage D69]